jgi:ParB family chromosome partitioning protein
VRIKRSRPQISNTIRLLRLPPTVQRRVAAGVLSAGHARALLVVTDGPAQERLAQRVVAEGLSVRALEELVTLGETGRDRGASTRGEAKTRSPEANELGQRLSDHFDTRVRVDLGKARGRITIEFASSEDLQRIVAKIGISGEGA